MWYKVSGLFPGERLLNNGPSYPDSPDDDGDSDRSYSDDNLWPFRDENCSYDGIEPLEAISGITKCLMSAADKGKQTFAYPVSGSTIIPILEVEGFGVVPLPLTPFVGEKLAGVMDGLTTANGNMWSIEGTCVYVIV